MRLVAAALLSAGIASAAAARGLPQFPLYKQCDSRWGAASMGESASLQQRTLCSDGSAVTSLAMALAGLGSVMANAAARPDSVNSWLQSSSDACVADNCDEAAFRAAGLVPGSPLQFVDKHFSPDPTLLVSAVEEGSSVFIARVRGSERYLLLTGVEGETFTVHDPTSDAVTLAFADVADVVELRVAAQDTAPPSSLRGSAVAVPEPAWQLEVSGGKFVIPHAMPLFKQCDSRWGSQKISTKTICQVGCYMTSAAMALAGHHIKVSGSGATPGNLNSWLRSHGGYSGNLLISSAIVNLDRSHISWPSDAHHPKNDVPLSKIQAMLRDGRPVIANVNKGGHFVLVTGWNSSNPDQLAVNDPGFSRASYSYKHDVVGWRLFGMKFA